MSVELSLYLQGLSLTSVYNRIKYDCGALPRILQLTTKTADRSVFVVFMSGQNELLDNEAGT